MWISFPEIPLEYQQSVCLIPEQVGLVVAVHEGDGGISIPRFCVKIDMCQGRTSTVVWFTEVGDNVMIPVIYDAFELTCTLYGHHQHYVSQCQRARRDAQPQQPSPTLPPRDTHEVSAQHRSPQHGQCHRRQNCSRKYSPWHNPAPIQDADGFIEATRRRRPTLFDASPSQVPPKAIQETLPAKVLIPVTRRNAQPPTAATKPTHSQLVHSQGSRTHSTPESAPPRAHSRLS